MKHVRARVAAQHVALGAARAARRGVLRLVARVALVDERAAVGRRRHDGSERAAALLLVDLRLMAAAADGRRARLYEFPTVASRRLPAEAARCWHMRRLVGGRRARRAAAASAIVRIVARRKAVEGGRERDGRDGTGSLRALVLGHAGRARSRHWHWQRVRGRCSHGGGRQELRWALESAGAVWPRGGRNCLSEVHRWLAVIVNRHGARGRTIRLGHDVLERSTSRAGVHGRGIQEPIPGVIDFMARMKQRGRESFSGFDWQFWHVGQC